MRVAGFTGARVGMTLKQKERVIELVELCCKDVLYCLHGDCVGADEDFDNICKICNVATKCMPCTLDNFRAHTDCEEISKPEAPMKRNRKIVEGSDFIISCPPNYKKIKSGSGTWATIGYARRAKKPLYIIYPDGTLDRENIND